MSLDVVQAGEILDAVSDEQSIPKDEYVASSGVRLKLKKVNRLIVMEAGRKIKDPPVPRLMNPDKGRVEENPADPDYIEAKRDADYNRGMITMAVYLTYGTEVLERPTSVQAVTDQEWADDLALVGIEVPAQGRARYLAWLKYHALDGDEEVVKVMNAIMRMSGLTLEEDVKESQESFRSA